MSGLPLILVKQNFSLTNYLVTYLKQDFPFLSAHYLGRFCLASAQHISQRETFYIELSIIIDLPIVDDMEIFFIKTPLAPAGLDFFNSFIKA